MEGLIYKENPVNIQKFDFEEFLSRYYNNIDDLKIFKVLDALPAFLEGEMWLAGGALRRTLIGQPLDSDFDFFFKNKDARLIWENALLDMGAKKISHNDHQKTFILDLALDEETEELETVKIQLITIDYYNFVQDLLDSFDFTITQFAYDGKYLYCGEYSLWDLARRRLAVHKITYGVASMRRLIKYTNQGFTACQGCLTQFLETVAEKPEVIRSDIQYVD